jgi:choline dehydrogenase
MGAFVAQFDYVIVGAGPAGCVLANRLSADPGTSVLLIEAGDQDTNPLIAMPRGFGQLLGDPTNAWHFPTRPFGPTQQVEHWVRGKTLGGSSAVNGMVYNRGQRADWDEIERQGNPGWGWDHMLPVFKTIEDNPLGASDVRGAGGPLQVSTVGGNDPLLEDVIAAGTELGWRRTQDLNDADGERIAYATATIRDGVRVSAANAFLHPILDRPNLTVSVQMTVDRVMLEGGRAVGVRGRQNGQDVEALATREVILATGALATPKILQLSGIGPADTLRSAGVDVVVDSPNVGGRMREHRVFVLQFRLAEELGYNKLLSTPEGQAQAMQEYQTSRTGVMAAPSFDIVGFFKTRPELDRPDAQFQIAPFSILPLEAGGALQIEQEPGMMCIGYVLRPDSEGSVHITSADPDAPLDINANYLATEHDRATSVDVFRGLRRLFATGPLAKRIVRETVPGPEVQGDQEIVDAGLVAGTPGYHAIRTCAMGPNDDDVVDAWLRVRGVGNLRVVDASVLPTMVSGNLNGPVSALAWRAADLILGGA